MNKTHKNQNDLTFLRETKTKTSKYEKSIWKFYSQAKNNWLIHIFVFVSYRLTVGKWRARLVFFPQTPAIKNILLAT